MESQCLMLESQSVRQDIYITWQLYTLHVMILTKYSNYKSPSYQDEISCHPLKQNLQSFHMFLHMFPDLFGCHLPLPARPHSVQLDHSTSPSQISIVTSPQVVNNTR